MTVICRFDAKNEGVRCTPSFYYTGKAPGWRCCAPEALHVISSALSLYHACGWIASIISEALPPGGDGRGGKAKGSAESIVSRWKMWDV